jgi:hypothetical protein
MRAQRSFWNLAVSFGMRQFRLNCFVAPISVSLVLMLSVPPANCRSRKSKEYDRADMTVPVPRFSIAVNLSERARQRLQKIHESVLAIAYFDGDPLPGQGRYNAPFRDVFLGNDQKLVDDQNVATFDSTKISKINWDRLANKDYFVTINVVSARKALKNNLLWCEAPEERLSTFEGKTTDVSCRLIEEQIDEHNPASPALKSLGSSPR